MSIYSLLDIASQPDDPQGAAGAVFRRVGFAERENFRDTWAYVRFCQGVAAIGASNLTLWGPFWDLGSTSGSDFATSGPPWRTMEATGWTRGGPQNDFHLFRSDLGTLF